MPVANSVRLARTVIVIAALMAGCRTLALDPQRTLTQYGHQVWLMEDGLPQHSVQALQQTRDGYLWLGTQEGLARFDGQHFTVFGTENVEAMPTDFIWSLYEDRSGTLWAGTDGAGAVRMKDGRFSALTTRDGLSSNRVYAVCEDGRGRYWFGTNGAGVTLVDGGKATVFGRDQGLPSEVVFTLFEDGRGTLWAGTDDGLARLRNGRFEVFPLAGFVRAKEVRMRVRALCEDGDGVLWVGTYHGLFRIRGEEVTLFTRKDGLCLDEVICLYPEKATGCLWVGTYGGLCRYRDGRFDSFTTREGLVGEQVWSLGGDREGSLWVGTAGGLNRLRDTKFYNIGTREGMGGEQVFAVFQAGDGALWIGTDGGGAARLADGRLTVFTTRDGLTSNKVRCFLEEADGSLLIGTDGGGIVRFRGGRFSPFGPGMGTLKKTDVVSLRRDARGTLWVGARPGLFTVEGGSLVDAAEALGLSDPNVTCTYIDRAGTFWVGTDGGGLNYLKDGRFKVLTTRDGLASNYIVCITEDENGALWVGTYFGGLSRYKDGRFTTFSTRNGLQENVVYALLEDDSGSYWMSGNRGIFKVPKRELEEVAMGRSSSVTCEAFGRSDGMQTNECNGGTQAPAAKTREGLLCFGTMKGLAVMDPHRLPANKLAPPVLIERVLIDGKPSEPRQEAALAPGRHRLEFSFAALSLLAPDKNRFKYRLTGFDTEWVEAGPRREAVYTIQKPGPYTFRVIAANNDGVWNEIGARFGFGLKPHFYETVWFYGLCALAVILAGWAAYSLRVSNLKARQAHLEILVLERTRDLAAEREKSEELLLNILPPYIAERKKAGAGIIADYFPFVSILFADIVDFTSLCARTSPSAVVDLLDEVFTEFDHLTEKYGLEKIKTIGDCYMAVAGIPDPREDAVTAVAEMAIEMQAVAERLGRLKGIPLRLRIGLHGGEAVAGVIGRKKFTYDLWGDAVNTASRMETHGEPGKIHCSREVYILLAGEYEFEQRSPVTIKGKGIMQTYLLLGRRSKTDGPSSEPPSGPGAIRQGG